MAIRTIFRKLHIPYTSINVLRCVMIVAWVLLLCAKLFLEMNYSDLSWTANRNSYSLVFVAILSIVSMVYSIKTGKEIAIHWNDMKF